jgi:hypothetical protein
MTMVSYVVYDTKTGEVVHLHVEPAGLDSSREEILQLADTRRARSLDIVRVPSKGLPAEAIRVVDGELRAAGNDVSSGAAGGAGSLTEPAAERRYEVRRPRGDTST